ncbi:MAG TPA: hypothetical protein DCP20_00720 [Coriobacteriia bacterium]|jgi:hypothetical protein|nr:MAG: hypothetical protein XD74_0812 [Actinobacteria bacterium 66_15]HAL29224.1 hypothetical protein [Coriobacteriia bacterium]
MPGGAEWLIIIGVIVLLFVPGLAAFGLGYLVGQKSGRASEPAGPMPSESGSALEAPNDVPAEASTDALTAASEPGDDDE